MLTENLIIKKKHFTRHSHPSQIILILKYVLKNLKKGKEIHRKK
jgi:hypothetical protein